MYKDNAGQEVAGNEVDLLSAAAVSARQRVYPKDRGPVLRPTLDHVGGLLPDALAVLALRTPSRARPLVLGLDPGSGGAG